MTRLPEPEAPESDAPLNQREAAKLATQQAVLAAARDSFEELGFERANLREIAARADVSAGTVLHYYGDKRGLLHARSSRNWTRRSTTPSPRRRRLPRCFGS
ncbi:MAG: helix-turn-helix transcriptional regulator [Sandaracinaceae bacterium]|nr:helix-turn-helix transcriptional regulator [Sandaracinaceae bacterium]